MLDAQNVFRHILSLVGHKVLLGTKAEATPLTGIIENAMFDSFILDTPKGRHIIRFEDLSFITPEG